MNISPEHRPLALQRPVLTRRRIALAAGLLLAGGAALAIAAKTRHDTAGSSTVPEEALSVTVTTPQTHVVERQVAASGSVAARDELIVGSDASGVRLLEVRVETGMRVRRGQLLARGDDAQLAASLAQQDALIRQARAERAQAESNLERALRVEDSGVYSAEAIEARRTAAESARAKLDLALAQRRELEVRIAHTRIVAPADGVISRRTATVGAVLQPGAELFRLIRDGELEWLAELPAHAFGRIETGAAARVTLDDGQVIEGRVRRVAPTIDTRSRNGLVHVSLPADAPLKAGAHLQGSISVARAPAATLPESVVFHRDGAPHVFVVDERGTARLTRIETGSRAGGRVELLAGVSEGARVVHTGAGFVKDGERVRVVPETVAARPVGGAS